MPSSCKKSRSSLSDPGGLSNYFIVNLALVTFQIVERKPTRLFARVLTIIYHPALDTLMADAFGVLREQFVVCITSIARGLFILTRNINIVVIAHAL